MDTPCTIKILATGNNERGDLFTRLMGDLFFALGYEDLRLNVHKTGREIDIKGRHRHERRRVIAECKAHTSKKFGGDDLNKLLGILTREGDRSKEEPVTGYFIALNGFTETAIEQEKESGKDGLILLVASNVIKELVKSHALLGCEEATEKAGRCVQHAGLEEHELDGCELLGHEIGYVWVVYYSHGKKRTHFALIHADGTALTGAVARKVIKIDKECRGKLHSMTYLAPPPPPADRVELEKVSVARYEKWIEEECGFIQMDGLPADTDLSATRLKLERLFVPLRMLFQKVKSSEEEHETKGEKNEVEELSVGKALGAHSHLAVLASPGGGKSTLLKRLAVAYTFPERRDEISDDLPKVKKVPLFLRCRELRDRAQRPTLELLGDLPVRAGMNEAQSKVFRELMHDALRDGRALLLIDGLDEISEEGDRKAFALNLRTFIAMFPTASLVVTSREAGFRLVAGVVASACVQASLAPLGKDDVKRLCERWNAAVVGDNEKVRREAGELAGKIWGNDRIRALAENPLLLTTLLVVKRWIGELPQNRAALYCEAVRVLIRTWNVKGFEPLGEDETLAQLSYVACSMMQAGQQQIGKKALLKLLQDARRELDAELGYAKISPSEFIDRIEYRSSLLMQVGHAEVEGELQELFEFRHLTFQEYLAARGFVQEQYPGRNDGKNLADLLEPHFEDERWREVIPLATVMAGRKSEGVIRGLTKACEAVEWKYIRSASEPRAVLLRQCLFDEVQVGDSVLRAALIQMGRHGRGESFSGALIDLAHGKFGEVFKEVVEETYLSGKGCWDEMDNEMSLLSVYALCGDKEVSMTEDLASSLTNELVNGSRVEKVRAALACMDAAFRGGFSRAEGQQPLCVRTLRDALCRMVQLSDPPLALAGCWALAWFGKHRVLADPPSREVLLSLYRLWREAESKWLADFAAWALSAQPLLARDEFEKEEWGNCDEFLRLAAAREDRIREHHSKSVSFVLGWYRRSPWSEEKLARKIGTMEYYHRDDPTMRDILKTLGEPGRKVLEEWDKKRK